MAAYPEIQQLVIQEKRAHISARYGRLYQELGLTNAQVEAFELIMISGVSSTFGGGVKNEHETVTLDAAPAITWSEKERRIHELLGDHGFRLFEQFERSPQDSRVAQLASALYFTDTPLTADQGGQFQKVLVDRNPADRDRPPAEYWEAVRQKAVGFLSEPQLAALRGLQATDEFEFAREQNQRLRKTNGAAHPK